MNTKRKKTGRKLLSFLLTLTMVVGLVPGMGLTAYAATHTGTVASQNISAGDTISSGTTINGNDYSVEIDGTTVRRPDMTANWSAKNGYWTAPSEYLVDEVDTVTYFTPTIKLKTPTIAVSSVTLDKTAISISINGVTELTATVIPTNATNKKVKWITDTSAVKLYSDENCENEITLNTAVETLTVYAKGNSVGDAVITAISNADSTKSASCVVTVNKADPSIETIPTASSITYGLKLSDSTLTGGIAKLGDTSVEGKFAWKNTETKPAVSDSDTTEYDVVFTPTDTENYVAVECKVKLTVNKAEPTVTAPTAKTLTYAGSAQELVNAGSTNDGKLYYAVTTENKAPTDENLYTTSIPTATDAGTYYVWYKVVGDADHNDSDPACVEATISKVATHTVAFAANGHGTAPAPQTVEHGKKATKPADPAASGYTFGGWFTDKACTKAYDFSAKVTSDLTLYAKWTAKATPAPTPAAPSVTYTAHVQGKGTLAAVKDGVTAGTVGESRRLEAVTAKLSSGTIEYRSHVQGAGWEKAWSKDGAQSGTVGKAKRVEAIQMRLDSTLAEDFSVWYRVHSQTFGWMGWARDGEAAGTSGLAKRVEAYEVVVLPKGQVPSGYVEGQASYVAAVKANAHVQGTGWTGARSALAFGTTGQARRLEALRMTLSGLPVSGGVSYEVHAQGRGWMGYKADGATAGTVGQAKRLEAVRIKLTGEAAKSFSVWYRVHSQSRGWLGWAHDGADAGTTGLAKRAEAVEVQVLPKGQVPSGYDASKAACVGR